MPDTEGPFADFPKCVSRLPRLTARLLSIRVGSCLAATDSKVVAYRHGRKVSEIRVEISDA